MRRAGRVADARARGDGGVQPRRQDGERRRCGRAPSGASSGRWRSVLYRQVSLSLAPHAARAALLGSEPSVRGNAGHAALLRSFAPEWRRGASTSADVVGRFRQALTEYQQGPLANYMPYTPYTEATLYRLAALKPKTLAAMHGSTF